MKWNELRTPLLLNGEWEFCMDPEEKLADAVIAGAPGVSWRKVNVPSDFWHACPERFNYEGVCWFRKRFIMPEGAKGRKAFVRFNAVNYTATVLLNGKFVGRNEQGHLPFEYEATSSIREDQTQELLVAVDNRRERGQLPTYFGWRNAGGIVRDVTLFTAGEVRLERPVIRAEIDGHTCVQLKYSGTPAQDTEAVISVFDNAANLLAQKKAMLGSGDEIVMQIDNPRLWSPDAPVLYELQVEIPGEDWISEKFGYRTIEARDGKILLNGKELFLKGFNHHEDNAVTGGAVYREQTLADFENMKRAGANFVRMCHYPHDESAAELADELGLILLEEVPVYWVPTSNAGRLTLQEVKLKQVHHNGMEMLRRLIERDRNHPSVCIWSVSNEVDETEPEINEMNDALVQYARQLDNTRLCVHVSIGSAPRCEQADRIYRYDDVICVNYYPSMGRVQDPGQWLKDEILRIKGLYPGKPMIVMEFGYATEMARDGVLDQEAQEKCILSEYPAVRECAEGIAVWLYADHLWQRTSGKELSCYGLVTRDRQPKKAFDAYSKLMKE